MAIGEELFTKWGWGTASVVGLGAALLAPAVLPTVGALLRPVVRGAVGGTRILVVGSWDMLERIGGQLNAVYEEAREEYGQHRGGVVTPAASALLLAKNRSGNPEAQVLTPETASSNPEAQILTAETGTVNPNAQVLTPAGKPPSSEE